MIEPPLDAAWSADSTVQTFQGKARNLLRARKAESEIPPAPKYIVPSTSVRRLHFSTQTQRLRAPYLSSPKEPSRSERPRQSPHAQHRSSTCRRSRIEPPPSTAATARASHRGKFSERIGIYSPGRGAQSGINGPMPRQGRREARRLANVPLPPRAFANPSGAASLRGPAMCNARKSG